MENPKAFPLTNRLSISRTLSLIAAIVLAEPLAATLLFPFVYFMVHDFGSVDDQYVGYRVGMITSAFFFPQMITTAPWGSASDRFGRKPVLLVGLLGSAVCMFLFGLSKSFIWALVSRGVCGMFNGNNSVARTSLGELAENRNLSQSKAFSLFGLCTAVGYVLGPLLGGLLARPATTIGIKGPNDVFVTFPYLLPCLVSTFFNIIVFTASWLLLEETNQAVVRATTFEHGPALVEDGEEEREPLLVPNTTVLPVEAPAETTSKKALYSWATALGCMLGIGFLSLHAIIFDEIYAIFAASSNHPPNPIGLGFSPTNIASSLSIMGPVIFVAQLFGFPCLNKHFNTLVLWRASAGVLAVLYPLFSLLPSIGANGGFDGEDESMNSKWRGSIAGWGLWVALLVLLFGRFVCNVVAYTSMAILLNHIAPPGKRGRTMGLAQSGISLGRAIGPALGGSLWSWSIGNGLPAPLDSHLLFFALCVLAIVQGLTSIWISDKAGSKN